MKMVNAEPVEKIVDERPIMLDDTKKLREELERCKKRISEVGSITITLTNERAIDTILAALRAVEALPKTADGAYVVPGMRVFYPIITGERHGEIVEQFVNDNLNIAGGPPYEPEGKPANYCWYSSRESAQAAIDISEKSQ